MSALAGLDLPWDSQTAMFAFLETVKLRATQPGTSSRRLKDTYKSEPDSHEFLSALAAGISSKRIVEIGGPSAMSTIALAAAANQTGGTVVCILPEVEDAQVSTRRAILGKLGLGKLVHFEVTLDVLNDMNDVQFVLVDCDGLERSCRCLQQLKLDERGALIVAHNLFDRDPKSKDRCSMLSAAFHSSSVVLPMGNGLEIVWTGPKNIPEPSSSGVAASSVVEVSA